MRFRFAEDPHHQHVHRGLHSPGIDWGYGGLYITRDLGDYIVFKVAGHKAWSGLGMQKWYEACYFIAKVLDWDAEYTRVEEVGKKHYPGHKWSACVRHLTMEVLELQIYKAMKDANH